MFDIIYMLILVILNIVIYGIAIPYIPYYYGIFYNNIEYNLHGLFKFLCNIGLYLSIILFLIFCVYITKLCISSLMILLGINKNK